MSLRIVEIQKKSWIMEEVVKLYRKIFQDPPWKEEFTLEEVLTAIKEQFSMPNPIALSVFKNNKVIGFAWMYQIFKSDLEEGTRYSPRLNFLFDGQKKIFYLQEIGIEKEMRGQGVGKKLIEELLQRAKNKGADIIVLSTNHNAKPIVSLISKVGFQNSGIIRPPKKLERTYWILDFKKQK